MTTSKIQQAYELIDHGAVELREEIKDLEKLLFQKKTELGEAEAFLSSFQKTRKPIIRRKKTAESTSAPPLLELPPPSEPEERRQVDEPFAGYDRRMSWTVNDKGQRVAAPSPMRKHFEEEALRYIENAPAPVWMAELKSLAARVGTTNSIVYRTIQLLIDAGKIHVVDIRGPHAERSLAKGPAPEPEPEDERPAPKRDTRTPEEILEDENRAYEEGLRAAREFAEAHT